MVKDEEYQMALKAQNAKAEKEPSLVQKFAANSKTTANLPLNPDAPKSGAPVS
jgi:hypothetical protein